MNIDQKLEQLKRVQQVEAPHFLLTRIRQRIDTINHAEAPVKWRWAFVAVGTVLLVLNLSVFLKVNNDRKQQPGIESYINAMHLSTSNDIYHD